MRALWGGGTPCRDSQQLSRNPEHFEQDVEHSSRLQSTISTRKRMVQGGRSQVVRGREVVWRLRPRRKEEGSDGGEITRSSTRGGAANRAGHHKGNSGARAGREDGEEGGEGGEGGEDAEGSWREAEKVQEKRGITEDLAGMFPGRSAATGRDSQRQSETVRRGEPGVDGVLLSWSATTMSLRVLWEQGLSCIAVTCSR